MAAPDDSIRLALREKPTGWPLMHMEWRDLAFLHWRYDPGEIQRRLPEGLTVDQWDGSAWIGIVPFFMARVRPVGLPAMPWLSYFLELNVRTYVFDCEGRPGVWFFSLSCEQPLAVETARRVFGLNYVHARMSDTVDAEGFHHYRCERRDAMPSRFVYRPIREGALAMPGTLEFFLVERYLLFAKSPGGKLVSGRVHHHPYFIAPAEVREANFDAAAADGLRDPGTPPDHILGATTLPVVAWPVKPVSA